MNRFPSRTLFATAIGLGLLAAVTAAPVAFAQQVLPPDAEFQLPPFPERPFVPPDWAPIPEDLQIVIIREDELPGQFRILDIELSREVDLSVIEILAGLLKDADEMPYQRTYIVYYLPGMERGRGGWATSHFLPELEVQLVEVEEEETPL